MKILLVAPSQRQIYGKSFAPPYPPLGLLSVGAILKKSGHKVKFIDIDAERYSNEKFVKYLTDFQPDLVAITCVTPTFNAAAGLAGLVKAKTSAKVMFGGVHPTIAPDDCLKNPNIDFLVVGEGEETVKELALFLESGRVDYEKIKGLWARINGQIIKGEARPLINDLDEMPYPAWELVSDLKNYQTPDALRHPVMSIMTTRGCPFGCTYCCSKQIFGRLYRTRSTASLIKEIRYYIDNFGVKELHIMDDVFTLDKARTLEICRSIQREKFNLTLSFANGIRADSIDDEVLKALKDTGFEDLGFGVETGDEDILKSIKKNLSKDALRRAFRLAKRYGFNTWGFFIIGLPGESAATIKKTIEFAIELDPDFAKFLILKPFPGSEVFNQLNEKGYIKNFNYDNYGVYTPPVHEFPWLSAKSMLNWQRWAYLRFYLRPKKIIRHLMKIKSWDQFKANLAMAKFLITRIFARERAE
ncbi:MAG: radical SAM protein [Patescibacteria group bacterium]|jgi:magnesium-protoporphyrin IX monomethyl ester (oxidative) cyclase